MDISIVSGKKLSRISFESIGKENLGELRIASSFRPFFPFLENFAGIKCNEFKFNGSSCYLLHRDLNFYDTPKISNSEESRAIYLADQVNEASSFLLQYLPPNSQTSRHHHLKTEEIFHNLEGECFLMIEGCESRDRILISRRSISIPSNTIHQVRTGDVPSLTFIEMRGAKSLSMEDHYYISSK